MNSYFRRERSSDVCSATRCLAIRCLAIRCLAIRRLAIRGLLIVTAISLITLPAFAQRGGDRGDRSRGGEDRGSFGGDRGSFGGDRGSFGGRPSFGGGSGFGGAPQGGFGGFGGDRSSFGGRPSFGGGPPSGFGGPPGGFGGPPGGFGGDRGSFGGDRGSFGGDRGSSDRGRGGPPGGFDPGDFASRMASRLDSNGNGQIDQDELDRVPEQMRSFMESRGINLRAGASVEELGEEARRSAENGGDRDGGRSRTPALQPFRPREKERLTHDLPPAYSAYDMDYDGQLAFHEWLVLNRPDLDRFDQMDLNEDGFLTPLELMDADTAQDATITSFNKERLVIVDASARRGSGNSRDNGSDRGRSDGQGGSGDNADRATQYFAALDRDGSGRIDDEEWERSRRVRSMFEEAGIRLSSMSEDEFVRNYQRVEEQRR